MIFPKTVNDLMYAVTVKDGEVTVNHTYAVPVPMGAERVDVLARGMGTSVVFSQRHSGWDVLDDETQSGKILFRCKGCGRVSQTPDKWCNVTGDPHVDVGRVLQRVVADVDAGRVMSTVWWGQRPFMGGGTPGQAVDTAVQTAVSLLHGHGIVVRSTDVSWQAWERKLADDLGAITVVVSYGWYHVVSAGAAPYMVKNPPNDFYQMLALRDMPALPLEGWLDE